MSDSTPDEYGSAVAVIGMAARFPGADTVEDFWENLAAGRESIRPIADDEFLAAGGDPSDLDDPTLVRMGSFVEGIDRFDAVFFGYSPADAELIDPQQRLLLETAYHAMEDSGYASGHGEQQVGVYAGAGDARYYPSHVYPRFASEGAASVAMVHAATSNSLGTLATRVSYGLGLTGPSMSLQTACSTGLVAVHTACQELIDFRCDMALAGAVSLNPAAKLGYRYVPGGPFSPDGRCRAFAADAAGTSSGDGVGVVVLKRLADALVDGDRIRAVIRGSAVNNDGRRKVGFAAPSTEGQLEVILAAQAAAGVDPDSIGFVEAHGTATRLGDPVEVAALTEAFRVATARKQFCALGSVKSNIGHLGAAAGMAGFIKAVLALEHGKIPPSMHFRSPNPLIDFAASPFRVPTGLEEWQAGGHPRRGAVSAFGVGGTNAHVIVEESPLAAQDTPRREAAEMWQVLPLSAATPAALRGQADNLAQHLVAHSDLGLRDVAYSLHTFRPAMRHRAAVVVRTVPEATRILKNPLPAHSEAVGSRSPVAFLLPGGGTQYVGMGAQLYRDVTVYSDAIDRCARILRPVLGIDLRQALHGRRALHGQGDPNTLNAFMGLVVTEYALATMLMEWGVQPDALIGHSLGEYTAACLAGVMSVDDMLPLVYERLRLIGIAGGATLGVQIGEVELRKHLTGDLSLAAVNGPTACTVAGAEEPVAALERRLRAQDVTYRRLRMPAAAHSHVLDPVLSSLAEALRSVTLNPPRIPYITNLTGTWISERQATSRQHWVDHTRSTVRFGEGIATLWQDLKPLLVEIGPGNALTKLACSQLRNEPVVSVVTMRHAKAESPDGQVLGEALGRLWAAGVDIDPNRAGQAHEPPRRVSLPGYAFDRRRHWIDAPTARVGAGDVDDRAVGGRQTDVGNEAPSSSGELVKRLTRASRPHLATEYVAPRTALEHSVARHWEEALGIEAIGVYDNFFDLGGDSMRAVMLAGRLRAGALLDVPATALLSSSTIAGLLINAGRGGVGLEAYAPVLPLRTDGDQPPLFCVHPGGGMAWRYAGLVAHLDARQPVYGIQAHGLDGMAPTAVDAKQMVDSYLTHLRAVQAQGPYRLLGWSYGGVVAHAMAAALRSQGEQIELLGMLDAPLIHEQAPDRQGMESQVAGLLLRVAGIDLPDEGAPADVSEVLRLFKQADGATGRPSAITPEDATRIAQVIRNNLDIAGGFRPQVFRGDVLFFNATGEPQRGDGPADPSLAPGKAAKWRPYVDGTIEEHSVPCSHYEMTEPGPMAQIGAVLAAALAPPTG
ncbi:acyltransferase domain-containing protein [Streptomyces sp. NBC_01210]|uniref:type I polyketide synthase n=1 Tax=Streptomyces sp. NBC_01210 TaxID=2903774 RepID=UPI002E164353|nr:acyltransferase domain-containing protein [Streptomyces sp. NBC_01210]